MNCIASTTAMIRIAAIPPHISAGFFLPAESSAPRRRDPEFLDTLLTDRQFSPEDHELLRKQLFSLRENALNTMNHLRRN